ncbi:MAG: hypothetical protein GWP06_03815 [Actinobacteria bacterium]|nr:hypothetical protein [Actinomycetota bacterium]
MKFFNKNNLIFLLLFLVFAIQIARHFNNFYVPESDFFDYREKAIDLRHFVEPANFKRPPLFSLSIAVLSAPLHGKFRELYAAELIVALSALFSLFFVYRIAKHFIGKHAFWLAWIWALHPTTLRMAIKPKPEMFVTVLILWAFDRFLKGDRKAYLIAFAATMVRYEGAIAIVAFFTADFLFTKAKVKSLLYAFLAGIPLVLWTLLHSEGSNGGSYGNYFNAYKPNFAFFETFWSGLLGFLPVHLFRVWTLLGAIFLGAGLVYGIIRFKKETTALLTYLLGFIVMHIIWPFSNIDYIVIIAWTAFLFIFIAAHWLYSLLLPWFAYILNSAWIRWLGFVLAACALGIVFVYRFPFPQYNVDPVLLVTFFTPVLLYFWWNVDLTRKAGRGGMAWALAVLLILALWLNSRTNADFFDIHYSKAEFRKAGEWFERNFQPGDKLAVAQPIVVSFFTNLNAEKDFLRITDIPPGKPVQVHDWLVAHHVTFIAWLSTNKVYEKGDAWYSWKRDNRGWRTIKFLEDGRNQPGFDLVKEIRIGPRWGYVYKLE